MSRTWLRFVQVTVPPDQAAAVAREADAAVVGSALGATIASRLGARALVPLWLVAIVLLGGYFRLSGLDCVACLSLCRLRVWALVSWWVLPQPHRYRRRGPLSFVRTGQAALLLQPCLGVVVEP